jgi:aryl-alcohol dehydrogenase-like predicted oxidoreductase
VFPMGCFRSDDSTGRLARGTAQLGMPYGVANRRGQPSPDEAAAILERALYGGIHCLDTAAGYGEAERLIGEHLRKHGASTSATPTLTRPATPQTSTLASPAATHTPTLVTRAAKTVVVTKLKPRSDLDAGGVRSALAMSRERLGVAPDVALLHEPNRLNAWAGAVGEELRACRAEGQVRAIGLSLYTPEQFAAALELAGVDVLQAPFSVLDRRLEQAGLLARAHAQGVRVMLRSVFLQGLLTMERAARPTWLRFAAASLNRWQEVCERYTVTPRTAALRFVLERTAPATVIVGCESLEQLEQLLQAASGPELPRALVAELEGLALSDRRLLDPTSWPT